MRCVNWSLLIVKLIVAVAMGVEAYFVFALTNCIFDAAPCKAKQGPCSSALDVLKLPDGFFFVQEIYTPLQDSNLLKVTVICTNSLIECTYCF